MDTLSKPPRATAARTLALASAAALLAPALAEAGRTAVVLTEDGQLARFDTDTPGTISGSAALSGLDAEESLLGIDFRPAAPDQLFGLSNFGQLYRINAASGSATKVGAALDADTVPLAGGSYGVDFNPTVDRVRVVSDVGENLRVDPDSGEAVVDAVLTFAAGDENEGNPSGVTAVAYGNNDTDAATATTLYGLDSSFGVLVGIDPPNAGTLNTIGATGQDDLPHFVGFDIFGADEAFAVTTAEDAFGSLPSLSSRLFGIDLESGLATDIGLIGDGSFQLRGLALTDATFGGGGGGGNPTPIPLPPAAFAFPLVAAVAGYFHRRARRAVAHA